MFSFLEVPAVKLELPIMINVINCVCLSICVAVPFPQTAGDHHKQALVQRSAGYQACTTALSGGMRKGIQIQVKKRKL